MRRKVKKKNHSLIYLVIGIIVGVIFLGYQSNLSASVEIPNLPSVQPDKYNWVFSNAPYRREILVSETSEVTFELNHAVMVIDRKSISSGYDLNIVAQRDNEFQILDFRISKPDSVKSLINFKLASGFTKYFLYYGDMMQNKSNLMTFNESKPITAALSEEESPILSIKLDKLWVLKENSIDKISLNLLTAWDVKDATEFKVVINNKTIPLNLKMNKNFQIDIPIKNLEIGSNSVYVYSLLENIPLRSNTLNLIYTSPIYVGWTMDWEGTAPDQRYINAIEDLAESYNIPITHYFNPRLYILLRASDQRRREITQWMVDRIKLGDDVALHIHMQHDLVEEAKVKAKYNEPSWDSGVSGYDTPTTAYSYEEIKKIISWGKKTLEDKFLQFANFELPELQGYRAGGWFANLDTLRAIEDNGFIYDSSGRSPFEIGKNKFTQVWNLQNTSQPYLPSKIDQSKSDLNNFNLLEIPNNGSDSYWSSAQDMISNFYANFNPGEFLSSDKIVVYLSHPDWFDIDEPKLKLLFNEISKYRNDKDLGPVKFVTMREYLEESSVANQLLEKLK